MNFFAKIELAQLPIWQDGHDIADLLIKKMKDAVGFAVKNAHCKSISLYFTVVVAGACLKHTPVTLL